MADIQQPTYLHLTGRRGASDQVMRLDQPVIRVGRGSDCEVRLREAVMAEVQLLLRFRTETQDWHAQPVGPPGRIWLNGKPLESPQIVPLEAPLRIGGHWLRLSASSTVIPVQSLSHSHLPAKKSAQRQHSKARSSDVASPHVLPAFADMTSALANVQTQTQTPLSLPVSSANPPAWELGEIQPPKFGTKAKSPSPGVADSFSGNEENPPIRADVTFTLPASAASALSLQHDDTPLDTNRDRTIVEPTILSLVDQDFGRILPAPEIVLPIEPPVDAPIPVPTTVIPETETETKAETETETETETPDASHTPEGSAKSGRWRHQWSERLRELTDDPRANAAQERLRERLRNNHARRRNAASIRDTPLPPAVPPPPAAVAGPHPEMREIPSPHANTSGRLNTPEPTAAVPPLAKSFGRWDRHATHKPNLPNLNIPRPVLKSPALAPVPAPASAARANSATPTYHAPANPKIPSRDRSPDRSATPTSSPPPAPIPTPVSLTAPDLNIHVNLAPKFPDTHPLPLAEPPRYPGKFPNRRFSSQKPAVTRQQPTAIPQPQVRVDAPAPLPVADNPVVTPDPRESSPIATPAPIGNENSHKNPNNDIPQELIAEVVSPIVETIPDTVTETEAVVDSNANATEPEMRVEVEVETDRGAEPYPQIEFESASLEVEVVPPGFRSNRQEESPVELVADSEPAETAVSENPPDAKTNVNVNPAEPFVLVMEPQTTTAKDRPTRPETSGRNNEASTSATASASTITQAPLPSSPNNGGFETGKPSGHPIVPGLPSARSILEACQKPVARPKVLPSQDRKKRPKSRSHAPNAPLLTQRRAPDHWKLPAPRLRALITAVVVLVIGTGTFFIAALQAYDQQQIGQIAPYFLQPGPAPNRHELEKILADLGAPSTRWWTGTAEHVYLRAVARSFSHSGKLAEGLGQTQELLNNARALSPVQNNARLAFASGETAQHLSNDATSKTPATAKTPTDASAITVNLGQSRDIVMLAWTGQTLLDSGRTEDALRAYRAALTLAARMDPADQPRTLFDEDARIRRYQLPGESLVRSILEPMAKSPRWDYSVWRQALPRHALIWLSAAKMLRQQGNAQENAAWQDALLLAGQEPLSGTSLPLHLASVAEAYACQSEWAKAEAYYSQALARMNDNTIERAWWYNLAEIYTRTSQNEKRQEALTRARGPLLNDDITRKAVEAQYQSGEFRPSGNAVTRSLAGFPPTGTGSGTGTGSNLAVKEKSDVGNGASGGKRDAQLIRTSSPVFQETPRGASANTEPTSSGRQP